MIQESWPSMDDSKPPIAFIFSLYECAIGTTYAASFTAINTPFLSYRAVHTEEVVATAIEDDCFGFGFCVFHKISEGQGG
jgi:hypothetical protein